MPATRDRSQGFWFAWPGHQPKRGRAIPPPSWDAEPWESTQPRIAAPKKEEPAQIAQIRANLNRLLDLNSKLQAALDQLSKFKKG